jgi:hypothetical protein
MVADRHPLLPPEYFDACLAEPECCRYGVLFDPVDGCPACAAEMAEILAVIRWREAEEPFNARALPLPPAIFQICDSGGTHFAH